MEEQHRYSRDIGEGVRQFVAVSASVALKQVREELGPDALIINQAQVGDRVIIEAAIELPEIPEEVSIEAEPESGPEISLPPVSEVPEEEPEPTPDLRLANIPIRDLRGVFRFVGGSGVGKTSLVIKIAVEYAMNHGSSKLLVLSTDQERLAGTEQLELSCQMLGIQLLTRSVNNLHATVESYTNKDLVLIDSPASELVEPRPVAGVTDVFVCSAEHSIFSLEAQRAVCGRSGYTAITHLDRPGDHEAISQWLARTEQELLALGSSGYLPEGLEMASTDIADQRFARRGELDEHAEEIQISISV